MKNPLHTVNPLLNIVSFIDLQVLIVQFINMSFNGWVLMFFTIMLKLN